MPLGGLGRVELHSLEAINNFRCILESYRIIRIAGFLSIRLACPAGVEREARVRPNRPAVNKEPTISTELGDQPQTWSAYDYWNTWVSSSLMERLWPTPCLLTGYLMREASGSSGFDDPQVVAEKNLASP